MSYIGHYCCDSSTDSILNSSKYSIVSASGTINALTNKYYLVDTSSGVATINLPASPNDGDWLIISDKNHTFDGTTHLATVKYANANTILLNAGDFQIDHAGAKFQLVYCANDSNWDVLIFN